MEKEELHIKGLMSIIHWVTLGIIVESECFTASPGKVKDYLVTYFSRSWSGEGITISYHEDAVIQLKVYVTAKKETINLLSRAELLQEMIHQEISLLPGCEGSRIHLVVKGLAD